MTTSKTTEIQEAIILHFGDLLSKMSDDEFFDFCQRNDDWHIERTSSGDLIIMPPTGGETGNLNFDLITVFGQWCKADGTGKGFDSSTGFHLPNGADRSPDLAWVRMDRWSALTKEQRQKFPPLAPDFVVEILSQSDALDAIQEKLQEYVDNGVRLGWLLDPKNRTVYIYRPGEAFETLVDPESIEGGSILPGFVLNLADVW